MRGYMVNNQVLLYDKFIKNAINNDFEIRYFVLINTKNMPIAYKSNLV